MWDAKQKVLTNVHLPSSGGITQSTDTEVCGSLFKSRDALKKNDIAMYLIQSVHAQVGGQPAQLKTNYLKQETSITPTSFKDESWMSFFWGYNISVFLIYP